MTTTRRELLAAGAAGAAAAAFSGPFARRVLAEPEREISVKPALVVLFLRGGQDALNTVVPHGDGRYYDIRPSIAIPTPDQPGGALDLDGTLGLHPALAGFKSLYDAGHLAPIVNAGSYHPSRSHFDCQDWMETAAPGDRTVHQGWLNRYLQATAGPEGDDGALRALGMQGRLPPSLRGDYSVLAVPDSLGFQGRRRGGEDVLDLFDPLYPAETPGGAMGAPGMEERPEEEVDDLAQNGRATIETMRRLQEIISEKPAGKEVIYPDAAGRLGVQLRKTARVLKAGQGLEVIGLDWNGWDHHINEGGSEDGSTIARMLGTLDAAVSTFFEDVRHMRSKVAMLIMTEFGRTNAENGNRGTDHGHGSVMFAIGGGVKGGKVHGEWTTLAPGRTYQNRDLEVTTDFRSVMADCLHGHMKLHPSKRIFPGYDAASDGSLGLFA